MMDDPTISADRLLFRISRVLGLLCVASAAAVPFYFFTQVGQPSAAAMRFGLAIIAPLAIGGTGALTIASRPRRKPRLGKALVWELVGIAGIALAWMSMFAQAYYFPIFFTTFDLQRFALFSVPLAVVLPAKLGCWLLMVGRNYRFEIGKVRAEGAAQGKAGESSLPTPPGFFVPRALLHRWFDAIASTFSVLLIIAWAAQMVFIIGHCRGDSISERTYILYDAVPPGIIGSGMLLAAAVARARRKVWGARLLGFGGMVALALSTVLTDGLSPLVVSKYEAVCDVRSSYASFAEMTIFLLLAKTVSAIAIGAVRWLTDTLLVPAPPEVSPEVQSSPFNLGKLWAQPGGRLADLLSFLAVLFIWFFPEPISHRYDFAIELLVPGPSMFVAGFPIGLVGVIALIAVGLLRTGRDRSQLFLLELFGIVALSMLFTSAALPYMEAMWRAPSQALRGYDSWIAWLLLLSWFSFGLTAAGKVACIAAGLISRERRAKVSLTAVAAFIVGCGCLAVYWRAWQP